MAPTTGNVWKWKLPVQLIPRERLRIPESSFQGHGNPSSCSTRRLDSNRLNRKINLFLNSLNKKWLIVFELLSFSGRCLHIGWLILWISLVLKKIAKWEKCTKSYQLKYQPMILNWFWRKVMVYLYVRMGDDMYSPFFIRPPACNWQLFHNKRFYNLLKYFRAMPIKIIIWKVICKDMTRVFYKLGQNCSGKNYGDFCHFSCEGPCIQWFV